MNMELFRNTKMASYFLWEYTGDDNAMNLWYCAEDIACCFERYELLSVDDVAAIVRKGRGDFEYVRFLRQVAYRVFYYTKSGNSEKNWFAAEHLINNPEWVAAIVNMAVIYAQTADSADDPSLDLPTRSLPIRSPSIRGFYENLRNDKT